YLRACRSTGATSLGPSRSSGTMPSSRRASRTSWTTRSSSPPRDGWRSWLPGPTVCSRSWSRTRGSEFQPRTFHTSSNCFARSTPRIHAASRASASACTWSSACSTCWAGGSRWTAHLVSAARSASRFPHPALWVVRPHAPERPNCPRCGPEEPERDLELLGVRDDTSWSHPNARSVLVGLACPTCGLHDLVKIGCLGGDQYQP